MSTIDLKIGGIVKSVILALCVDVEMGREVEVTHVEERGRNR